MQEKYWAPLGGRGGILLAGRAALAWDLIKTYGLVAGVIRGEDRAGRAICEVMPVPEVVSRAFGIADLFVATAERREELRACTAEEVEATAKREGDLARLHNETLYPRSNRPQPSLAEESDGA